MANIIGTPGADELSGTAIADTISGLAGNDTIDGGAGADTLIGGAGDDSYIVDHAGDTVIEAVGGGTDVVNASVSFTLGANVENLVLTGAGDINGTGNALANSITGNSGANLINGFKNTLPASADTQAGGDGNDTYVLNNVGDVITELANQGTDTLNVAFSNASPTTTITVDLTAVSSTNVIGAQNVENVTVLGTGKYNIVGSTADNLLIGNAAANNISAGAGNDTLVGGLGNDTLIGGDGNDVYRIDSLADVTTEGAGVGSGTDTVEAAFALNLNLAQFVNIENATLTGAAAANLTGTAGGNVLTGNAGANLIDGGTGNDTMDGGAGNDTYVVDALGDVVTESIAGVPGGIDVVRSAVNFTLGANIEKLELGNGGLTGTGNALANTITGGTGADSIDGGAGADTLIGGAGDDTYIVDNVGDKVTEALGGGTDLIQSFVTYTLSANVENLVLTGAGDINGTGNALANSITGNSGANLINGFKNTLPASADILAGGDGNDTYVLNNVGDVITELANQGTDTLNVAFNNASPTTTITVDLTAVSSTNVIGAQNVENVTVLGTGKYNIVGSTADNLLIGNAAANNISAGAGNDTLVGGLGNDTLIGGDGNDVYRIDSLADVTTEGAGVGSGTDTVEAAFALNLNLAQFVNIENATLTGAAAANLTGTAGGNVLTGNAGANLIDGGTGNDTMDGGAGNDTYVVDALGDVVTESIAGVPGGIDVVRSAVNFTLGANIEKLELGNGGLTGTGNALANTITGGTGADSIDGGAGADTLIGGAGDDTYIVDNVGDKVTEALGGGTDLIQSFVTYTLSANVENLVLTGAGDINGTGNALANSITGNSGANLINGFKNTLPASADILAGGDGNDTYVLNNVGDVITELANQGTDTLNVAFNNASPTTTITVDLTAVSSTNVIGAQNVENVTVLGTGKYNIVGSTADNLLIGNAAANNISAGAGNDTLVGGLGNDTLIGGDGNDVYRIDSLADVTTEGAGVGSGTDTVEAAFALNLNLAQFVNIENATLTGAAAANLTGTAGGNVLTGNAGANLIDGGTGNDTMDGGAGNDTYVVDALGDVVTESIAGVPGGIDVVRSAVNFTLGANIEKLELGNGGLTGTGNALANTITGGTGADSIDGGAGADTLIGGAGDDTYIVDNVGDKVTESLGGGTDLIQSFVTYTLSANVENLKLIGSGNINATGNSLANTITGNDGNNVLLGGGGADTFIGLGGNDTYTVDSTTDVVTEANNDGIDTVNVKINNASAVAQLIDMTLAAAGAINFTNIENVTLLGTGKFNITGNDDDNILTGNAQANELRGGLGDDTLVGGGGADTLVGGAGNDVYRIGTTAGVTITEAANGGSDTIEAGGNLDLTQFANIEDGTLTGAGAFTLTGSSGANTLTGNAGANLITGGGGADTMDGGAGNDTYVVDSTSDVVAETGVGAAGGVDTVRSTASSFALGANIENLVLLGAAISGTGNALANVITGNANDNTLDGGAGADTLIGGAGDDTYIVDNVGDKVIEALGGGTDVVRSSVSFTLGANVENLVLTGAGDINGTGNALANSITGNSGANLINGFKNTLPASADILAGGDGNDTYVLNNVGDVITELANQGTDTLNVAFSNASPTTTITVDLTAVSSTNVIGAQNVENVTVLGTGKYNIVGSTADNLLIGNAAANNISAGAGNDTLVGGLGNDTLIGGDGNDVYRIDSLADVTTEGAGVGSGTDTVEAAFALNLNLAQFVNIENATLTGAAAANLTGTAGDNVLTGNAGANLIDAGLGNDVLDGGAGNDTLIGGAGNDTYVVDSLGDSVQEVAGGGTDLVRASISYSLGFNVENLTLIGTADIDGTGNGLDNIITGNAGNNRIDGLGGADTMIGGAGNDTYVIDNAGDTITEAAGAGGGVDTVEAAIAIDLSLVAFANIENATLTGTAAVDLTGNGADNLLVGNSADNHISGGVGNDTLIGGLGADTLIGGNGNDVYVIDASDTITEGSGVGSGIDTVQATFSIDLADFANIENATLLGTAGASLTGDAGDNVLTGNSGANLIDGGAGNDTLIGGLGADTLIGGDGSDVYRIDATDVIVETGGVGVDTVEADFAVDLTLAKFNGIENATLTGVAAVNLTGDELNNVLIGNISANKLDGGIGNDTLDGGAGNDTLLGGAGDDNLSGSDGNDSVSGGDGNDSINGGNGADTIFGDAGDDTLHGGADNDRIDGGIGNDSLDGGTGNDTLIGGAGNDTYTVDSVGDVVTEAVGGGTDTVNVVFNNADPTAIVIDMTALSSAGVVGVQNAENVTITGTGLFDVIGNDADNTITGNGSANELHGGLGNDTLTGGGGSDSLFGDEGTNRMVGGTGNDSYYTSSATDTIVELAGGGSFDRLFVLYSNLTNVAQTINLTTLSGGNVEWAFIQGSGLFNITGSAVNNFLSGNSSDNVINGLDGNDTIAGGGGNDTLIGGNGSDQLDGGAGADSMDGGSGNDTYSVDNVGDVIAVDSSGIDTVTSSITYSIAGRLDLENISLLGSAAINATGNSGDNAIDGNSADNVLTGGDGNDTFNGLFSDSSGNDTMVGGLGDDLYFVDNVGDVITEAVGEGTDTVGAVISYTLGANVENLQLVFTFGNINGTGNELDNVIGGNEGNNVLDGALGNDTLNGNGGLDTMTGGGGDDVFEFNTSTLAADAVVITDFTTAGDSLHFDHAIYAALGAVGALDPNAFEANGTGVASTAADRLVFNTSNGHLFYDADGSGAGAAVLVATLQGGATLASTDIHVI